MCSKIALFNGLILLVLVQSFAYANIHSTTHRPGSTPHPHGTTSHPRGTTSHPHGTTSHPRGTTSHPHGTTSHPHGTTPHPHGTTTRHKLSTTRATKTVDYPYTPYVPKDDDDDYNYYDKKGKYGSRGRYGNNYDRNDNYDRSDEYDRDRDDSQGDYNDKDDMYASMNIWIRDVDNWENPNYRKGYQGKTYKKKKEYKDVKFPVRRYKNIRKFPRERFPPLISIMPWLPIFYDRITYQTFIFSPTGGIYILPPLINFYGRRFAVAQLIKWGYASLVSSGAPPPPNVNVAPLVQPAPPPPPPPVAAGGAVGGAVGGAAAGPAFDSKKGQFMGGVKTNYANFEPRYKQTVNDGGRGYGSGGNYGGTGRQEVYAQGGPRSGGYN